MKTIKRNLGIFFLPFLSLLAFLTSCGSDNQYDNPSYDSGDIVARQNMGKWFYDVGSVCSTDQPGTRIYMNTHGGIFVYPDSNCP